MRVLNTTGGYTIGLGAGVGTICLGAGVGTIGLGAGVGACVFVCFHMCATYLGAPK